MPTDIVIETSGNGDDTVRSSVAWILGAELERLHLQGGADINGTGNLLGQRIGSAMSGNNLLNGIAGADSMAGGDGNDTYIVDKPAIRDRRSGRRHRYGPVSVSFTWTPSRKPGSDRQRWRSRHRQ